MPVDRPTFSESWYRVAELRPRLLATLQVYRQHFRGQTWHVIADPASNQFFRLNEPGYRFIALLDGRRTVAEAWRIANDQLGDAAPTQGEAIQLLGQLYTSNLLSAELPPDAEGLFRRYRKRITREVQGYLTNLLFVRIPLLDPDRFLERWVGVFGRAFTWYGGLVWLAMIATGLYFLAGHFGELVREARVGVLDPSNLPWLYVAMIFTKVFHEFGHGFACKKFGRQTATGGEVHTMGVMFLVFTPLPYVDASSSWAFRGKWQRVVVGLGGMYVELFIAAVAAIVWVRTGPGLVHSLAFNVIFIAGVSTVLFNANPLLRYDGYYVLSDLLEMPNLWQRSRQYLHYLVKRYAWAVRRPFNPANTAGERGWLLGYAIASTIYRIVICVAILLFIAERLFIVGAVLAVAALIAWVLVPLGRFVHYLATHGELARVRPRAVLSTLGVLAALAAGLGTVPVPDRCRAEGVVEPVRLVVLHAAADGFVVEPPAESGSAVRAGDGVLASANPILLVQAQEMDASLRRVAAQRRMAFDQGQTAAVRVLDAQARALGEQLQWVREQIDGLTIRAPLDGTWVSPQAHRLVGAYVQRGQPVGMVADPGELIVRAVVGQDDARLIAHADPRVELRLLGRPTDKLSGRIIEVLPAGQEQLPSAALGYAAGGSIAVRHDESAGTRALERVFEVRIAPDPDPNSSRDVALLSGQRVVVRFTMPRRPLAEQWWRSIRQLVQRRFHI